MTFGGFGVLLFVRLFPVLEALALPRVLVSGFVKFGVVFVVCGLFRVSGFVAADMVL